MGYSVGVDIGGTFTDCVAIDEAGRLFHAKVPSTHTSGPVDGVLDGLRRLAEEVGVDADTLLASADHLILAIADELTVDGLVLRYRTDATDDGLTGEEGTFTICSFWLVSALAEIGEMDRARTLCEKLLSYASPLLLYAEEIEPHSGRHLGNFPQAFTHLALINAVMHIIDADQVLSEGTPDDRSPDSGVQVAPAGAAAPKNGTANSHPTATGDGAIGHVE
ncbi:MAG TPA: glycoside hydrolase family 15 protein [Baekduia sp.]|nr:glycoside hydrolase family 15 protein [Baekduia sp.]